MGKTDNNKRCVILAGGSFRGSQEDINRLKAADYIICADGGGRFATQLGLKPNLLVGDFDTLTPQELQSFISAGVEIIRYPSNKDYTDTHLALLKALELGFGKIDIFAALGGRLDHEMANIMLLALPEAKEALIRILDDKQEVSLVRDRIHIQGKIGQTVSLLPLVAEVKGIKIQGLHYQVPQGILQMGVPIGISNYFCAEQAVIEIEEGLLLVVVIHGED